MLPDASRQGRDYLVAVRARASLRLPLTPKRTSSDVSQRSTGGRGGHIAFYTKARGAYLMLQQHQTFCCNQRIFCSKSVKSKRKLGETHETRTSGCRLMCTIAQFILLRGAVRICMATEFLVCLLTALGVSRFSLDTFVRGRDISNYTDPFRGDGLYIQQNKEQELYMTLAVRYNYFRVSRIPYNYRAG